MGKYVAPECDSSFRGGGERRPEKVSRRKKKFCLAVVGMSRN